MRTDLSGKITLVILALLALITLIGGGILSAAGIPEPLPPAAAGNPGVNGGTSGGSTSPPAELPPGGYEIPANRPVHSGSPEPGSQGYIQEPSNNPNQVSRSGSEAASNPASAPENTETHDAPVSDMPSKPSPSSSPKAVTTPSPKPTPSPTPKSSPAASSPSNAPRPTPSPVPTPSPAPKPSPAPSPSPTPSAKPSPTPSPSPAPAPSGRIILGYYGGWAAYSGYTPDKIPAQNLTHLNYAFAKIGSDMRIALGDPKVDPGNLEAIVKLRSVNPKLKILISVGGWDYSGRFSDMASSEAGRNIFADSVVDFILKYRLDGVDIDWEYPVSGGLSANSSRAEDKQNYTSLLAAIRGKLDAQGKKDGRRYLLTMAGSAGTFYPRNTELGKIHQYLDYALVMTYDIHGNWDKYTDLSAPLYTPNEDSPQYKWSADSAVKMYVSAGFPASKLVLGIPFYGYVYKGVTNSNNGLYQLFSSGSTASYDKILSTYASDPSYKEYVSSSGASWLFNGSTFVSYDNAESISKKTDYIVSRNLAGAGIWEISQNRSGALLKSVFQALK